MAKQKDILESEDVLSLPRFSKNNDILEKARISDVLFKSLQTSTAGQNRDKLLGLLNTTKGHFKQRKLEGLVAVLDSLLVPASYEEELVMTGRSKGYLSFELAFDLYADFVYTKDRECNFETTEEPI